MWFKDEAYVGIARVYVFRILNQGFGDVRGIVLLRDEDVAGRRRPMQAKEIIVTDF